MKRRNVLIGAAAIVATPSIARAQKYPNAPITIVVALAPGGSADATMRFVAKEATEQLGVQVIIENRPGGAQTIATTKVARSKPDGYTLLQTTQTPFTTVPHLQTVPYDVEKDFTYIAQYATLLHPNYVLADNPIKSWEALIEFARSSPDALRWAAATPLSGPVLANEAAFQMLGIKAISVPYKGGAEAVNALLGGHIDMVVSSDYAPLLSAGKVRLLSEIGADRAKGMEDIPCFGELGYPLQIRAGFGLAGPANLPDEVVETWVGVFKKIDASPQWKDLMGRYMALPALLTTTDFRQSLLSIYKKLGTVLPTLNLQK